MKRTTEPRDKVNLLLLDVSRCIRRSTAADAMLALVLVSLKTDFTYEVNGP